MIQLLTLLDKLFGHQLDAIFWPVLDWWAHFVEDFVMRLD